MKYKGMHLSAPEQQVYFEDCRLQVETGLFELKLNKPQYKG